MPQMMYSFFDEYDEYDFTGKTIIPFSSHGGSGFSGSVQEIAELEPNASVSTDELTISRTVMANSENTIVNWLEKLGVKTDWRYFMSYWSNSRICSAIGGIPPAVKRRRFYSALTIAA